MKKYVLVNILCNDHGGIGTVMGSFRHFIDKDDEVVIVGMTRHEFVQKLGDDKFTQIAFDEEPDKCIEELASAYMIICHQPMAHLSLQKYFNPEAKVFDFVHVDSQRLNALDSEYGSTYHALNSKDFNTNGLLLSTQKTKDEYKKKFPHYKMNVVANNIDINEYSFDQYANSKRNGFVYVGRIEKNVKNIFEFVRMVPLLREAGLSIDIYGKGIHQDEFFKIVEEEKLEDVLIYKGTLPNSEVVNEFSNYKAQLSVSTCDCFPTIVLEGYKSLTPIIAYNSFPSAVDMIEDGKTGFLIENGNLRKFVEKMVSIDNGEVGNLDTYIYDYRQKFSIEKLVNDFKKAVGEA